MRLANPEQSQIILAYTRSDVKVLNEMARVCRGQAGELGKEYTVQTERGERSFAINDRLYFLKNDRQLGVMNGTLGTLESVEGNRCQIRLDANKANQAGRLVNLNLQQYNHLEHGYAATIHKAQGVTVDRSYVLGSRYLDAHATYVGMSRHQISCDLFYAEETFPRLGDLVDSLSRDRSKDISLDYFDGTRETIRAHSEGSHVNSHQTSLDTFRAEFEASNPDRAKVLQETLGSGALRGEAEKGSLRRQAEIGKGLEDFSDFTRRFESRHPERAQQLSESLGRSESPRLDENQQSLDKDMAKPQEFEKTVELSKDKSKGFEMDF